MNRRDFLRLGVAAGAVVVAANAVPGFSWADVRQVRLGDCMAMTSGEMANNSKLVQDSWKYLKATVATIKDAKVNKMVTEMISDPVPTFLAPLTDGKKEQVWNELKAKNLIDGVALADFLQVTARPCRCHAVWKTLSAISGTMTTS